MRPLSAGAVAPAGGSNQGSTGGVKPTANSVAVYPVCIKGRERSELSDFMKENGTEYDLELEKPWITNICLIYTSNKQFKDNPCWRLGISLNKKEKKINDRIVFACQHIYEFEKYLPIFKKERGVVDAEFGKLYELKGGELTVLNISRDLLDGLGGKNVGVLQYILFNIAAHLDMRRMDVHKLVCKHKRFGKPQRIDQVRFFFPNLTNEDFEGTPLSTGKKENNANNAETQGNNANNAETQGNNANDAETQENDVDNAETQENNAKDVEEAKVDTEQRERAIQEGQGTVKKEMDMDALMKGIPTKEELSNWMGEIETGFESLDKLWSEEEFVMHAMEMDIEAMDKQLEDLKQKNITDQIKHGLIYRMGEQLKEGAKDKDHASFDIRNKEKTKLSELVKAVQNASDGPNIMKKLYEDIASEIDTVMKLKNGELLDTEEDKEDVPELPPDTESSDPEPEDKEVINKTKPTEKRGTITKKFRKSAQRVHDAPTEIQSVDDTVELKEPIKPELSQPRVTSKWPLIGSICLIVILISIVLYRTNYS